MTDKPTPRPRQLPHHLPVYLPRNPHTLKRPINDLEPVKSATPTLRTELGAVFRFGRDELGD